MDSLVGSSFSRFMCHCPRSGISSNLRICVEVSESAQATLCYITERKLGFLQGLFHDLSIYHMTVSSDPIGTAMLGVLLLLSFPSLVTLVPPPSAPLPCRRCCDDLEQEEGSGSPPFRGFNHVPEVRTFINMTILKGNSSLLLKA